MSLEKIFSLIAEDLSNVEKEIAKNLDNEIKLITTVGLHIMESGGKRLRPCLLLLTSKMLNNQPDERILLSVAIEYIHTATLLHDDVVDNSTLRRGRKSANSIWGNEASVLVGDFLFAKAFSLMVRCNNIRILQVMSEATEELAEGEIFELIKTGDLQTATDEYFKIITKKTAVLFAAACEISGVLAGIEEEKIQKLKKFGVNIGQAFQLADDVLDYISTDEVLGKKIGIDIEEGKVTYPLIASLKKASEDEYHKIKEIFYKDNLNKEDIEFLKNFVIQKKGTYEAIKEAKKLVEESKQYLSSFENNNAKKALIDLADFIVNRRF